MLTLWQGAHQPGGAASGKDPGTGQEGRNITCEEYSSSQSQLGVDLFAAGQTLVLREVSLAWKARVIDEKEPVLALLVRDLRQQGKL